MTDIPQLNDMQTIQLAHIIDLASRLTRPLTKREQAKLAFWRRVLAAQEASVILVDAKNPKATRLVK